MTKDQLATLVRLLAGHMDNYRLERLLFENKSLRMRGRHGLCIGADLQFHGIVRTLGWYVIGHPPIDVVHMAQCECDELLAPEKHMRRNKAIVMASDWMYGAPYEMQEQERGGTWATIRMARKAKKPLTIVYPDGSFRSENM